MAISFIEKRKKIKYLFPVLAVLILIIIIVVWHGFFAQKIEPFILPEFEVPLEKIEIDFQVFSHPLLEELRPFPEIEPFDEEVGRDNPFISY